MQIGAKLKELRILNGLTQEELADRTELSKGFISQLERDLTSPPLADSQRPEKFYGTDSSHTESRRFYLPGRSP